MGLDQLPQMALALLHLECHLVPVKIVYIPNRTSYIIIKKKSSLLEIYYTLHEIV
jgi:hypothetical protein